MGFEIDQVIDNALERMKTGLFPSYVCYTDNPTNPTFYYAKALHRGLVDYSNALWSVVLQNCMNNLPVRGGGIFCKGSRYNFDAGVELPNKPMGLFGEGIDITYFYLNNGVNASMFNFTTANKQVAVQKFKDFTAYGNLANQGAASSIFNINPGGAGHLWDARFYDLFLLDARDYALTTNDAHHYQIRHCIFEYNGRAGASWVPAVALAGGETAFLTDCLFKLNNARGLTIIARGSSIVGCQFVQNGENGLVLGNRNISVNSCYFEANGTIAANTYDDLVCGANYMTIENNKFEGGASSRYNVVLEDFDYNVVLGNLFYSAATGPLRYIAGAVGNIIEANQGYNPRGNVATPYTVAAGQLEDWAGAQAFPTTHTDYTVHGSPKLITIYGGTVTAIFVDGVATGLTSGAFFLNPGQVLHVDWTGQPSSSVYAC